MSDPFILDARLASDGVMLGDLGLSRVLVMNDSRYPWLILVPRLPGLSEIFDLAPHQRQALIEETALCARALKERTGATKMNVGALGNIVAQLHIHIVARSPGDFAWPGPVWGQGSKVPYDEESLKSFLDDMARALPLMGARSAP